MRVLPLVCLITLSCILSTGCASSRKVQQSEPAAAPAEDSGKPDAKRREQEALESKLAIARLRHSKSQLERAHSQTRANTSIQSAKDALAVAEAKLATFEERDAPQRISRARLDVARSENYLRNERDELAQLEMMYSDAQLSTKTDEIVIDRQKRSMELAERNLELDRADLTALESSKIPNERRQLELEVIDKRTALERAEQEAELSALSTEIEIAGAEAEVARLGGELAELLEGKSAEAKS
jgi:hypothetical protein